jgi:hypothetical protein
MKKMIMVLFLAMTTSGCYHSIYEGGVRQRHVMPQVGVILRIQNNCAPLLDLERPAEGIVLQALPFGNGRTVPLSTMPFTGTSRQIAVIVKGYTPSGEYLGSQTKTFHVSTHRGSREEVWIVDRLTLPGGRGGCQ